MQTWFWKMLCVFSFHLFPTCCQFVFHFFWLTWHILLVYSFKSYFKNVIYYLFAYILHLLCDNIFFWWSLVLFHILLFLFYLFLIVSSYRFWVASFFIISYLWMRWVLTGPANFRSLGYVGARTIFCINTFFFHVTGWDCLLNRVMWLWTLGAFALPTNQLQPCCPQIEVSCPWKTASRLPGSTCSAHIAVVKWMAGMLFWLLGIAFTSCSTKWVLVLLFIHYFWEPIFSLWFRDWPLQTPSSAGVSDFHCIWFSPCLHIVEGGWDCSLESHL